MLIIQRKSIVYSSLGAIALVASLFVNANEWAFSLRLLSCVLSILVCSRYTEDNKYKWEILVRLGEKLNRNPDDLSAIDEMRKKIPGVFYIISLLISLGSGLLLCPSLNFGTEPNLADLACGLIGAFFFFVAIEDPLIIKGRSRKIDEEAERLFEMLKDTRWNRNK